MVSVAFIRAPLKVSPARKKARPKGRAFHVESFLYSTGLGKSIAQFKRKDTIFRQGDAAKEVFYIQGGSVKLIVVNESGREAVVAILEAGDFFGEGCLTTQSDFGRHGDLCRAYNFTRHQEKGNDPDSQRGACLLQPLHCLYAGAKYAC